MPGNRTRKRKARAGESAAEKLELICAVLAGFFLALGALNWGLTSVAQSVEQGCYAVAFAFGALLTCRDVVSSLRRGHIEIDTLMLGAAVGALFLGELGAGALLLFLFSIGHAAEHYATGRAQQAIEALAELAPKKAWVRRQGRDVEIDVEELERGDTVLVKPHQRLPADGFIVVGQSSIDQSPITGESMPVDKGPVADLVAAAKEPERIAAEHRVFAGTINGSGALEIQVTRHSEETTLARVVRMVTEAEHQKSRTQQFTDRFEKVYVHCVLTFVVFLMFAWVVVDEPFRDTFYRAMAVLVVASPCALALATPSAVLSAIARAGRSGVLVKGGGALESLGQLKAIAFDKTGTLTEGKPKLVDVVPSDGATEAELLEVAVAVERLSDHPLGLAVVQGGTERLCGVGGCGCLDEASQLECLVGRGVTATVDGEAVFIGNAKLFKELGTPLPDPLSRTVCVMEEAGRTTMVVRRGRRFLGTLGLMDTPREPAPRVISELRKLGIEQMVMVSGDNQRVADAVGEQVGVDQVHGDLMPDDKVQAVKDLGNWGGVAVVGDGVNDAPAMANATVGIAMGAVGSDVAIETADIALMGDDLSRLPFAVNLSRKAGSIIRQNLCFSLAMVVVLIPATLLGLSIGPAVALHEGSTVVVVFNALRLLACRG